MLKSKTSLAIAIAAFLLTRASVSADHVVITGKNLPGLLGKPISSIVIMNRNGAIPFQIDEITADGEYVLDGGELPNGKDGDGALGGRDEIAFLWDDAVPVAGASDRGSKDTAVITLSRGGERRFVYAVFDPAASIPRSPKRYIEYNHGSGRVATPYYYADFAKDRFHFARAGLLDFSADKYIDLAGELRVEILLTALFGLLPIRYGENDLVCFVRRYKAGPVRLIRRGDFHLNLGLGVKGSRAAVNQICYPRAVGVPVYVHLPVRFRTLFGRAHIEMLPTIREAGRGFVFSAPSENLSFPADGPPIDTLHPAMPLRKIFTLRRGRAGYGWVLDATMPPEHTEGSGFIMRRPSSRPGGIAECGFRLSVKDVPKGNYYITNTVLFSAGVPGDIERLSKPITVVND
jgi:hypothetical protein